MTTTLTLCAAAAVTWVLRILTITLVPAHTLPATVQRALQHVGPAVLAAIITAGLLSAPPGHHTQFILAATATAIVAWRGRGPLVALVAGLLVVTALSQLADPAAPVPTQHHDTAEPHEGP